MPSELPPQPLLLAWVVEDRRVLVVGGGAVSTRRVRALRASGAEVIVVATRLSEELLAREDIAVELRPWREEDLDEADLVMVAVDEAGLSERIASACRERRVPVHVADVPALCDFYFPATWRQGSVQLGVSTGGAGPALAARLRDRAARAMPEGLAEATGAFARLRQAAREEAPAPEQGPERMRWLKQLGQGLSWEELASLGEAEIAQLVAMWREEQEP